MIYSQPTGNKIIKICAFCGEVLTKKALYCETCKTKAMRKEKMKAQLELEKENKEKGFNIPNRLFMFDRTYLLKAYKLKNADTN